VQDWQNKCTKIFVNSEVVDEWSRIAAAMNDIGKQAGKGKGSSEDTATEMMALLEAELKTVHDVMGKKYRCGNAVVMLCCARYFVCDKH
jgi:hypothetical protein